MIFFLKFATFLLEKHVDEGRNVAHVQQAIFVDVALSRSWSIAHESDLDYLFKHLHIDVDVHAEHGVVELSGHHDRHFAKHWPHPAIGINSWVVASSDSH